MGKSINLKDLTMDELQGVVNFYPWFVAAKMEFCRRMAESGSLSQEQCADAALYLPSLSSLKRFVRKNEAADCTDANVSELVKVYTSARSTRVSGGDYFSQSEYDNVRRDSDAVFNFIAKPSVVDHTGESVQDLGMYTETLAKIYADQGYYDQAKAIYTKLASFYPERREYFEKLANQ